MKQPRPDWRLAALVVVIVAAIAVIVWRASASGNSIQAPNHMPTGSNAMKYDPNNPAAGANVKYFASHGAVK